MCDDTFCIAWLEWGSAVAVSAEATQRGGGRNCGVAEAGRIKRKALIIKADIFQSME
jgi:hypothetical protein